MTFDRIRGFLDKLNVGDNVNIFLYNISENVDYGKVWHTQEKYCDLREMFFDKWHDNTFYFIKDADGKYVAAILVNKYIDNLQWFVKEDSRKKGILTQALKTTILPHLLSIKHQQVITIEPEDDDEDSFEASRKVALNVGFKEISETEFLINRENVQIKEFELVRTGMSDKEIEKINRGDLQDIMKQLKKINDELEIKLGGVEKFERIFNELLDYSKEDFRYECQQKNRNLS